MFETGRDLPLFFLTWPNLTGTISQLNLLETRGRLFSFIGSCGRPIELELLLTAYEMPMPFDIGIITQIADIFVR